MKALSESSRVARQLVMPSLLLFLILLGVPLTGMSQENSPGSEPAVEGVSLMGRVSGQDEEGKYVGVIPNAVVEFLNSDGSPAAQANTNETGYYQIKSISPGSYTYRVSAEGYSADDVGRGIEVPVSGAGSVFDFILTQGELIPPKLGTLSGHAWEEKDGKRSPIAGAQISAKMDAGQRFVTTVTDGKGFYTFSLPSGGWKTSAIAVGKNPQVNPEVVRIEEDTPATVDFIFSLANIPPPPVSTEVYTLISAPSDAVTTAPKVRFVNQKTGEAKAGKVVLVNNAQSGGGGISLGKLSGDTTWHQAEPVEPLPVGSYFAEAEREGFPTQKSSVKKVSADQSTWFDIAFVPKKKPGVINLTDTDIPGLPDSPIGKPVNPEMPVTPVTPTSPVMPDRPEIPGQPLVSGISGRVSGQNDTGEYLGIIPTATVEVLNGAGSVVAKATTNQTGYYEISFLGAGNWTYRITAPDYASDDAGRGFTLAEGAGVQVFDFILSKKVAKPAQGGVISGTVVQGEGRNRAPLGQTMISLRSSASGAIKTVMTGENGKYRIELPALDWEVSALTPRFKVKVYPSVVSVKLGGEESADFNFAADDDSPDLPAKDVYVLASIQTDREGISQAPLIEFVSVDGQVNIPAVVNPLNRSALQNVGISESSETSWKWYEAKPSKPLPEGRYRVQGRAEGCVPASTESQLVSRDASVIFDLAINRLRAEVPTEPPVMPPVDTKPKPMPVPRPKQELNIYTFYDDIGIYGVSVKLVKKTEEEGEGNPLLLTTNDEGSAKGILKEGAGTYRVFASVEGSRDYIGEVEVSESNRSLKIEMIPYPRVAITVKNSAGDLLTGVNLRLIDKTRNKSLSEAEQQLSDDFGRGIIFLKDGYGDFALMAGLDGFVPAAEALNLNDDPAAPGTLLFEKTITVYKDGEIRPVDLTGVLVELSAGHDEAHPDGKKVPNAQIVFQSPSGADLPEILRLPLRTGSQGEFSAKAIPEGTYPISIAAEGYEGFTGSLKVTFGMKPVLLSLVPRNMARDNWIRMILSEGWGDVTRSRKFHQSGTTEDKTDSNVDFALGMTSVQAEDRETAVPAFALAVSKVSDEKWWDRACEGHLWTLMHYRDAANAVAEIRRLTSGDYMNREETDESRETAYLFGVAVGVMMGPWTGDSEEQGYIQLDTEVTAALKGTLLAAYETGKKNVSERHLQLSNIETKAKKNMADSAAGERKLLLANLGRKIKKLQADLNSNQGQQKAQGQKFTKYHADAEATIIKFDTRLAEIVATAEALNLEITKLQKEQANGMQAQMSRRLQELQKGLDSNLVNQKTEEGGFTQYNANVGAQLNGYVARMKKIITELGNLGQAIANADAQANKEMAGGDNGLLEEIKVQIGDIANAKAGLDQQINQTNQIVGKQIAAHNAELVRIRTAQQARVVRSNALNEMSPYCAECQRYSEKPPECAECAKIRRDRDAELIRITQEYKQAQGLDQRTQNLSATAQGEYDKAVKRYNMEVANLTAADGRLRDEYTRAANQMNKPRPKNPRAEELRAQDSQLRVEHKNLTDAYAKLENEYRGKEAEYLKRVKNLKQIEAGLRGNIANVSVPSPKGNQVNALLDQKTKNYTKLQTEYEEVKTTLEKVRKVYPVEADKHKKEIERLTGLAATLTNQINEIQVQIDSSPASGAMSDDKGRDPDSVSLAFSSYYEYPLERRRKELLDWVTRSAKLTTPASGNQ